MEPKDLMSVKTMKKFFEIRDELNLTDRQRKIFFLKFSRGWRYIDIAEELGINQDTVTADMKVIREKLTGIANPSQEESGEVEEKK